MSDKSPLLTPELAPMKPKQRLLSLDSIQRRRLNEEAQNAAYHRALTLEMQIQRDDFMKDDDEESGERINKP